MILSALCPRSPGRRGRRWGGGGSRRGWVRLPDDDARGDPSALDDDGGGCVPPLPGAGDDDARRRFDDVRRRSDDVRRRSDARRFGGEVARAVAAAVDPYETRGAAAVSGGGGGGSGGGDGFEPQRSRRAPPRGGSTSDGDTWVEIVVVTNRKIKGGRRVKRHRSLFYSIGTRRAHWDEPPSGASKIVLWEDMERSGTTVLGAAMAGCGNRTLRL